MVDMSQVLRYTIKSLREILFILGLYHYRKYINTRLASNELKQLLILIIQLKLLRNITSVIARQMYDTFCTYHHHDEQWAINTYEDLQTWKKAWELLLNILAKVCFAKYIFSILKILS